MHKSKVVEYMKTLSKSELRAFSKYIVSPYVKKADRKIVDLFEHLKKYYPDFDSKMINREKVHQKLYPNATKVVDKKLRDLMSGLTAILEDYFVWLELKKDDDAYKLLQLKALSQRNLLKYFATEGRILGQQLDKQSCRDADYFRQKFDLNVLLYNYSEDQRLQPNNDNLQAALEYLDCYYYTTKLALCSEVINRERILAAPEQILFLEELLNQSDHPQLQKYPAIHIYQQLVYLMQKESIENFFIVKKLYFEHIDIFGEEAKQEIYAYLYNSSSRLSRSGNPEIIREHLEIYQFGLKKGLLLENGILSFNLFQNIINVACAVEELEWAGTFIKTYSPLVKEEERANAVALGSAYVAFMAGDCEQSLDLLRETNFVNIHYNIVIRCIQLMCYYELPNYEEVFFDSTHSFTNYLRRNKIVSSELKTKNNNLVKFAKKLFRIKIGEQEYDPSLVKELENTTAIAYRRWLSLKIQELTQ